MTWGVWTALLAIVLTPALAEVAHPYWGSQDFDESKYGAYPYYEYGSFDLASPRLNILHWDAQCEYGNILLTPRGSAVPTPTPLIIDGKGNLVWAENSWQDVEHLRVQTYKGEDFITFWAGDNYESFGQGRYYLLDSSYQTRHTVEAAGDLREDGDFHEFTITPNDTALLTIYHTIPYDLKELGVKSQGYIIDSIFQEIDIATGRLIFEWRASDHFPVTDSRAVIEDKGEHKDRPFDYFHINSIDKDAAGNYWISSRFFCAVYCISAQDGSIIYALGGDNNDFADLSDGKATSFTGQHHATWHHVSDQQGAYMTLLDNGAHTFVQAANESRALRLYLDLSGAQRPTAKLLTSYTAPISILSKSQGSVQVLPPLKDLLAVHSAETAAYSDETLFVGWGRSGAWTEFDLPTGRVLCHVNFAAASTFEVNYARSYRTFKSLKPWVGRPKTRPNIGTWLQAGDATSKNKIYASWNGATEVQGWHLQGSNDFNGGEDDADEQGWTDVMSLPKQGFEVVFDLKKHASKRGSIDIGQGAVRRDQGRSNPQYRYYRVLATSMPPVVGASDQPGLVPNRNFKVLGVSYTLDMKTRAILAASSSNSAVSPLRNPANHLRHPRRRPFAVPSSGQGPINREGAFYKFLPLEVLGLIFIMFVGGMGCRACIQTWSIGKLLRRGNSVKVQIFRAAVALGLMIITMMIILRMWRAMTLG